MTASPLKDDEEGFHSSRNLLLWSAHRIVGSSDAEVLVQDAFERAWRSTSFRSNADLRPRLNRIVRNAAIDVSHQRARAVTSYELQRDVESAESTALRRETPAMLAVTLGELPPQQRRAIALHDVVGYSSREIAKFDGIATIPTRLLRAPCHALTRNCARDRFLRYCEDQKRGSIIE
jgi:RNA polymerase sigma-70 factor (ECF subfamily)